MSIDQPSGYQCSTFTCSESAVVMVELHYPKGEVARNLACCLHRDLSMARTHLSPLLVELSNLSGRRGDSLDRVWRRSRP